MRNFIRMIRYLEELIHFIVLLSLMPLAEKDVKMGTQIRQFIGFPKTWKTRLFLRRFNFNFTSYNLASLRMLNFKLVTFLYQINSIKTWSPASPKEAQVQWCGLGIVDFRHATFQYSDIQKEYKGAFQTPHFGVCPQALVTTKGDLRGPLNYDKHSTFPSNSFCVGASLISDDLVWI